MPIQGWMKIQDCCGMYLAFACTRITTVLITVMIVLLLQAVSPEAAAMASSFDQPAPAHAATSSLHQEIESSPVRASPGLAGNSGTSFRCHRKEGWSALQVYCKHLIRWHSEQHVVGLGTVVLTCSHCMLRYIDALYFCSQWPITSWQLVHVACRKPLLPTGNTMQPHSNKELAAKNTGKRKAQQAPSANPFARSKTAKP